MSDDHGSTPNIERSEPSLGDAVRAAAPRARREVLERCIRAELCSRLGLEPGQLSSDDRLMDLGVNSLKAVELKEFFRLELHMPLRSSLLFDYPTIDALVAFLLHKIEEGGRPKETVPTPVSADGSLLRPVLNAARPDDLSDDDLVDSLSVELRTINLMLNG
jgi:acyl carrier protein